MERLFSMRIEEYKYDTQEEREEHVKQMKAKGYEVSWRKKRSDDSIWKDDREYYWFGEFSKYDLEEE